MERISPGSGQESVWDYPRPPRTEPTSQRIRVELGGVTIADSTRAVRVLETSSPPVYYIPPEDIRMDLLVASKNRTVCEFKGLANYWNGQVGDQSATDVAWSYQNPTAGYESIQGHLAFYASRVDACFVDDERVEPQPGSFYGGWITSQIVGPFKGAPGTEGW